MSKVIVVNAFLSRPHATTPSSTDLVSRLIFCYSSAEAEVAIREIDLIFAGFCCFPLLLSVSNTRPPDGGLCRRDKWRKAAAEEFCRRRRRASERSRKQKDSGGAAFRPKRNEGRWIHRNEMIVSGLGRVRYPANRPCDLRVEQPYLRRSA